MHQCANLYLFKQICVSKVKSEIINLKSEIDTSLPVMEYFYTLQGEGFHQGKLPILYD